MSHVTRLLPDGPTNTTLSNQNTDGHVIIDVVRFVPVSREEPDSARRKRNDCRGWGVSGLSRNIATLAAVGLCLVLPSCGQKDTHEKIMGDTLELMEQFATALEQARDNESARQAAREIEELVEEFDEIAERSDAVGKPTPEVAQDLAKKFSKRRTKVLGRISAATTRARSLDEGSLLESLEHLGKSWSTIP